MAYHTFNNLEKLKSPPFVTTSVDCPDVQRVIHKTWTKLRTTSNISEKSKILETEAELLAGFIERKGTQLRLEKALMLSNRIHKLSKRWLTNKFLHEYTVFDDGVQLSLQRSGNLERCSDIEIPPEESQKDSSNRKGIRLPSRQWANWIIYLTLRDSLILAKIKVECERTVKYWLGLISSSHHATDSLVAVGILSRIWYESSSIVETLIKVMYPTVCKLSIHLEPTKAENWLTDLEIPSPENIGTWLATILGSPFIPATLSRGMGSIGKSSKNKAKIESVFKLVETDSKSISEFSGSATKTKKIYSTTATAVHQLDSDEDLGVPVDPLSLSTCSSTSNIKKKQSKSKNQNTSVTSLNDRWTRFFTGYKSKLKTEKGKKQFLVRIRNYLKTENDKRIVLKLKKFRRTIRSGTFDEIIDMVNQFQKTLLKKSS